MIEKKQVIPLELASRIAAHVLVDIGIYIKKISQNVPEKNREVFCHLSYGFHFMLVAKCSYTLTGDTPEGDLGFALDYFDTAINEISTEYNATEQSKHMIIIFNTIMNNELKKRRESK